ncbi:MAG: glycerol-3-phosphate 1-O-acyltransferase PlsY [Candidatus Omnitrophica bacterium]|nr:glycerol-3-phosphate 1-O-acyltransferase PlsY [Candidatus Omnitrophota bacterium]
MEKFLYFLLCYLIGSIPFGYYLCKFFKNVDIRKFGSGNIGATNVYRVFGWKLGLPVLIFDILKGFFSILIGKSLKFQTLFILIGGIFSIFGHSFPIFLKGRGGKGVATSFGVIIGLVPLPAFIAFFIWLIIVFLTRFVSLGSLIGAFSLPFLIYFYKGEKLLLFVGIFISIFILYNHRENIKRLFNKKENKIIFPWEKR